MEYSTQTDSWTARQSLPGVGRVDPISFSLNNKGYIGCGRDENDNYLKDFYEYTPATVNVIGISGAILTETGIPIQGVTVTLSGDDYQTTTTDTAGHYTFTVAQGGSYNVIPSKNNEIMMLSLKMKEVR